MLQHDHANGMSEILLGGVLKPLWTYTRFLTARPIRDVYGIVETPDTAGLVDPSDAPGKELRSEGPTTASPISLGPQNLQKVIKENEREVTKQQTNLPASQP